MIYLFSLLLGRFRAGLHRRLYLHGSNFSGTNGWVTTIQCKVCAKSFFNREAPK